jgi:hypothetical protein
LNNLDGSKEHQESTYAINWQLSVPQSAADEFATEEDISQSDHLIGKLNLFIFMPTTSDYYIQHSLQAKSIRNAIAPVGVYSYIVDMHRLISDVSTAPNEEEARKNEIDKIAYPFVWRTDGPVELDKYFGY